jgi:uncharacterized protein involved in exopolysaccharide biosynthesis
MPTSAADGTDHVARRPMQKGIIEGSPTISRRRRYTDGPREETSLLGFINVLLRHRRLIAVCALTGAVILGVSALNSTRMFLAYATFTVRGSREPMQMSGIAAQLGLTIGSGDGNQTPAFYGDLVTSRAILRPVSRMIYTISTPKGRIQGSLASFFGIDERNPGLAASRTLDELHSRVSATSAGAGIITVRVRAERPQLTQQILQNMLSELGAYNLALHRNRAAAERDFVEGRLTDARERLTLAESQLSIFLQVNRDYSSAPALRMENDRLERAVQMRQQLYTAVAQSFEGAKTEEARDLPTISVIDQPEARIAPERSEAIRKTLLGLIAGLLVGIVLAFVRERAAETRDAGTHAYTEYSALKTEALGGLARPWAPIGRLLEGQNRP